MKPKYMDEIQNDGGIYGQNPNDKGAVGWKEKI